MSTAVKSYHLLWTPGFVPALLYWTFVQGCILLMILNTEDYYYFFAEKYEDHIKGNLLRFSHEVMGVQFGVWSLISLLSSACCAFQLILNVFSVGCAGFNKWLGPLRPFFLGIAIVGQTWMWSESTNPDLVLNGRQSDYLTRGICGTLLVVLMSLLPEILWWKNNRGGPVVSKGSEKPEASLFSKESQVLFSIEGMSCIACVNTIRNAVTACGDWKDEVEHVDIQMEVGKMTIDFKKREGFDVKRRDEVARIIAEEVSDRGFPTEVMPATALTTNSETPATVTVSTNELGENHSTVANTNVAASLTKSFIVGLLSSSCCLLQLTINVLSMLNIVHIGCAGFNKWLGPARDYIRAVSIIWLSYGWAQATTASERRSTTPSNSAIVSSQRSEKVKKMFRATGLTLFLMFLPELLMSLNLSDNSRALSNLNLQGIGSQSVSEALLVSQASQELEESRTLSGDSPVVANAEATRFVFTVDNMGCEACVDMVTRVIRSQPHVEHVDLDFATGRAEIHMQQGESTLRLDEGKLNAELGEHGYELRPEGWTTKKMIHDAKQKNGAPAKGRAGLKDLNPFGR